ncbi:DUF5719 family protein [Nocardioides sp.]|uniref:DUF5719 family protein n=1 Tax=Nocardioides sp. TaxID=35761 RepID=UPI003784E381
MSAPDTPSAPGRRSARRRRRVDATMLLAVVLPLVVLLAVLAVRPGEELATTHPPTRTALTRSTVVCPSAAQDAPEVALTTAAADVDGSVRVGLGADQAEADVVSGQVTTADGGSGPLAVTGEDETAPGLVAARFGTQRPAAATCLPPRPDAWFTGVGSGAGHTSVLELTNPDAGTAVADVLVYGADGLVDAPRLRGVSVPGGSSVQVDLAQVVPRRDELTLEVITARGRIGSTVVDSSDPVGRAPARTDWLPGQSEPSTTNLLMGLASGKDGRDVLTVANGGPDEVRATVQIVTDRSVFTPKDAPDLRIPPQSTVRLVLSGALADLVRGDDATGLRVTSTEPVTATLRTRAADDLSHTVPDPTVEGAATVLLPEVTSGSAAKTLLIAGAVRAGVVDVVTRSASGRELSSDRVEVAPDRGASLELPTGAALVTVTPSRTTVAGAVLVEDDGAAVVPLTVAPVDGLVPAVGPGLP